MKSKIPSGFVNPNDTTKHVSKYTWKVSLLDTQRKEISTLLTDEPWEKIIDFSRRAIGTDFSGLIVKKVRIFGEPENAPEDVRTDFEVNRPTWKDGHNYVVQ